jgi:lysyl-tRNA synthetase class 2
MATIDELKKVRLEKLKSLQDSGVLAFPATTKRTHSVGQALELLSKLFKSKKSITLAGRIMALRGHGGATFLDMYDGSGKIQGLIKTDKVGEKGYKFLIDHFDIGDFIEITGNLIITKRGEKTIEASDYKMLAKSLVPLPEKWHGLQDEEEKLRKRYLDILFNPEVADMIKKRAVFWNKKLRFWKLPLVERMPGLLLRIITPLISMCFCAFLPVNCGRKS